MQVQSVLSPITAVIMFIVSVFSPGVRNNPEMLIESADTRKVLTVFSRNSEFEQYVGDYKPDGTELKFVSEYAEYSSYDIILKNGWQGEDIDIYIVDSDSLGRFLSDDTALPMSKLGISEAEVSGLFRFNAESGKNSAGELCALPVVNAPGVFLYKRSAAKKLFGTDDPEVVQNNISDWSKFLKTAELAKSKGVIMTTNANEMYLAFAGGSSFTDGSGKLSVPSSAMDWISAAKTMTDNGYVVGGYSWTDEWMNSFTDPDIFGHFAASWLVEGVLPMLTESSDYAVCAGPQYYFWGGSYALVNPRCKNPEAAAELLRRICVSGDLDTSKQITAVIPGNRGKFTEMQPIVCEQMGDQDIGKLYLEVLDNISPTAQKKPADCILSEEFKTFMIGYLRGDFGDISVNKAVELFCDQMKRLYPEYA